MEWWRRIGSSRETDGVEREMGKEGCDMSG
jgi:hypothetical protein